MAGQVRLAESEEDLLEVIMSPSGREKIHEEKEKLIEDRLFIINIEVILKSRHGVN